MTVAGTIRGFFLYIEVRRNLINGVPLEDLCAELKELELAFNQYAERRVKVVRVVHERRQSRNFVHWRTAQARAAYMIQMHRQTCAVCQSISQDRSCKQ